jgi:hypothetical protein
MQNTYDKAKVTRGINTAITRLCMNAARLPTKIRNGKSQLVAVFIGFTLMQNAYDTAKVTHGINKEITSFCMNAAHLPTAYGVTHTHTRRAVLEAAVLRDAADLRTLNAGVSDLQLMKATMSKRLADQNRGLSHTAQKHFLFTVQNMYHLKLRNHAPTTTAH